MKIKTKNRVIWPSALLLLIALLLGGRIATAQNLDDTFTVTVLKYVDGSPATSSSTNNAEFSFKSNWNAENLGGTGSNQFNLNSGGNYQTLSSSMSSGSSYRVSETMDRTLVGTACRSRSTPTYKLTGYSSGNTLSEAQSARKSRSAPNLRNLTGNKYVIIWNSTCPTKSNNGNRNAVNNNRNRNVVNNNATLRGEVTGSSQSSNNSNNVGNLVVNSVKSDRSTATADGTFENGLVYTFNITVPTNETHLSMRFADWTRSGGGGTIGVANNVRISSAQADNSGATVLLTGANVYSSPALNITGDLDSSTSGNQVQVKVEVAVPSGTPNGSYVTTYGVKTT